MTSTYTSNKYLEEPGTNDQVNTWGGTLNSNFSRIDTALGGVQSINLTGVSGNLDLTNAYPIPSTAPYSYIASTILLSGTPTGNVSIRVPSGVGGVWTLYNNYAGAFTVTFANTAGGSSVVLSQSYNNLVTSDGSNIYNLSFGGRSIGTSANNLVALDSSARLPAVNGSLLTNLPGTIPTASVIPYAGASAPSGWLLCSGQYVSTTTYAALYAVIGGTFGTGSGTFGLPDLRGRVVAGLDNLGGTGAGRIGAFGSFNTVNSVGGAGGLQYHQLTSGQMPYHQHIDPYTNSGAAGPYGSVVAESALDMSFDGTNTSHSYTSGAGNNEAHNNMQPTMVMGYIIKT